MGYTLPQIAVILAKADRTMYKIGAIAYDDMFNQLDESLDYERDIIYIYKVAVEYADNFYVGTEKLDTVVERLGAKVAVYDFGQLTPIYSDSTIVTQVVPVGAALDDLSDVTITNLQDQQTLKYNAALGQWVNVGTGNAVRNTQQFTATAGQTTFTTAYQFDGGLVDIFVNGVKLSTPSYTVFGNYTIILTDGCVSGDIVEIVAYENNIAFIDLSAYYVPVGRTITINGVTYDLSANRSWTTVSSVGISMPSAFTVSNSPVTTSGTLTVTGAGTTAQYIRGDGTLATFPTITSGTVTSVDMSVPTGLTISGNPITTSGTLAVGLASGYSIPTTASQATWNTAYNDSIVSAGVTGTTTKTLTLNQQDGGIVTATWSDLNTDAVTSVFGRTGAVFATEGDYTLTQLGDVTLTSPTNGQVLKYNGTTWVNNTDTDTGLTSVGLTMPSAFAVANSPLTSNGTIAVTGAGTSAQYVRGDGQLANFPTSGGGGSSVNYYLNGSINQGTFGGVTYYEMSKTPIIGAGTDFTRTNGQGNGYIASFITDAGDPALLNIPGGNWNLEFYFEASSGGGNPAFYGEIYKVSSSNVFTLIASGSTNPEVISGGTIIDQYFTSIPMPQTSLLATDRIAIRVYVITDGRDITLHTENSNLCEVLTTFSTGLNALNGLTEQVQYFATGTTGTDFAISSVTDTHTFNLPTASATNRGALSSADWSTFSGKVGGSGSTGQVAYWNGTSSQTGSNNLFWDAANARLGIGTTTPSAYTHIKNTGLVNQTIETTSTSGRTISKFASPDTYLDVRVHGSTYTGDTWFGVNSAQTSVMFTQYGHLLIGTYDSKNLYLGTNNATRAVITAAGRLLLGTTTEGTYLLDVNGTARVSGAYTNQSDVGLVVSASIPGINLRTPSAGRFSIISNYTATNRTSFLVGTGTSNPTFEALYIDHSTGASVFQGSVTASSLIKSGGTSSQYLMADGSTSTLTNPVTGTGTTNYLPKWTSSSALGNSLVYDNGTNVLINTTSDSGQKLQVNGTIKADGRIFINAGNGNQLYLNNAGERYTQITFDNNSTSISQAYLAWDSVANFFEMYAKTGGGLKFYANQSEAMIITTSSFVGIGTSTPSYKLDVNRSSLGTIAQFITLDGTYNPRLLISGTSEGIQLFATYSSGGAEALMFGTANSEKMRLTSNLLIGSTVDSGERLQVTGSAKITGDVNISGVFRETLTTNRQTASYTLALADNGKLVEMNVATANNLTVPLNSSVTFPIGTKIDIAQYGAGQTTIVATSGVTVRSAGGALKLTVQYSGGSLVKIGTDEWYLFGDITV